MLSSTPIFSQFNVFFPLLARRCDVDDVLTHPVASHPQIPDVQSLFDHHQQQVELTGSTFRH